jgi:hypothetical protein
VERITVRLTRLTCVELTRPAGQKTLHGFGFASVIADLGLPKGALFLALFACKLGVEVAQTVIVRLVQPAAYLMRGTRADRTQTRSHGGSASRGHDRRRLVRGARVQRQAVRLVNG